MRKRDLRCHKSFSLRHKFNNLLFYSMVTGITWKRSNTPNPPSPNDMNVTNHIQEFDYSVNVMMSNFAGSFSSLPPNFASHSPSHSSIFSSTHQYHFASLISNKQPHPISSTWILYTGATHMIWTFSFFTTITSTLNIFVELPNGTKVEVMHF